MRSCGIPSINWIMRWSLYPLDGWFIVWIFWKPSNFGSRVIFPCLSYIISGLPHPATYIFGLKLRRLNKNTLEYKSGKWKEIGKSVKADLESNEIFTGSEDGKIVFKNAKIHTIRKKDNAKRKEDEKSTKRKRRAQVDLNEESSNSVSSISSTEFIQLHSIETLLKNVSFSLYHSISHTIFFSYGRAWLKEAFCANNSKLLLVSKLVFFSSSSLATVDTSQCSQYTTYHHNIPKNFWRHSRSMRLSSLHWHLIRMMQLGRWRQIWIHLLDQIIRRKLPRIRTSHWWILHWILEYRRWITQWLLQLPVKCHQLLQNGQNLMSTFAIQILLKTNISSMDHSGIHRWIQVHPTCRSQTRTISRTLHHQLLEVLQ